MAPLIACRDCGAIQHMPAAPKAGKLECCQCARALEKTSGRSLGGALACSLATFVLLFPMNLLSLMTVHAAGISLTTYLYLGLAHAWHENFPLAAIALGLVGVVLPFLRFGLLSATLAAIRFGARGPWVGAAFRYSETLDIWAMADVLLVGAGIGYGRVDANIPVHIDVGGWCLVGVSLMTMITRASLERRAVWQRLEMPPSRLGPGSVACTHCDLVLPPDANGKRCPRCRAWVHRRQPFSLMQTSALLVACWVITPLAYAFPLSQDWEAGVAHPHTITNGIELLLVHGFWYFGVIVFMLSVALPFTKLAGLTWFVLSLRHPHTMKQLRRKTRLYRFIDESGRWSMLDPFTVMIFTPMIQFHGLIQSHYMGGTSAYVAAIVMSMMAARIFDPRLMWDHSAAGEELAILESARA